MFKLFVNFQTITFLITKQRSLWKKTICYCIILRPSELRKILTKISKLKGFEVLSEWIQPCINHLHWSATTTPTGDGNIILAKFKSFLGHTHENLPDLVGHTARPKWEMVFTLFGNLLLDQNLMLKTMVPTDF